LAVQILVIFDDEYAHGHRLLIARVAPTPRGGWGGL
jgi:hypothetical protein